MPSYAQRFLVADDVVDARLSIKGCIQKAMGQRPFTIVEAANGEEALRLVEEVLPDIMVLDLSMYPKSGWDVLKELKEKSRLDGVYVLVYSQFSQDDNPITAVRAGAKDFIDKLAERAEEELTTRILAAVEFSNKKRELEQVQKEFKDFVRITGHDVGNDVRLRVLPCVFELEKNPLLDASAKEEIAKIKVLLNGIQEYAIELRFYSDAMKKEDSELVREEVNLSRIVRDQVSQFLWSSQNDIKTELDLPDGIIVNCNSILIRRVFHNVLENSRKAIAESREIRGTSEQGRISVIASKFEDYVEFKICDSGTGFPEYLVKGAATGTEDSPYRYKGVAGSKWKGKSIGSGLGLPFCYRVISAHGGKIEIFNGDKGGACVMIQLPCEPRER